MAVDLEATLEPGLRRAQLLTDEEFADRKAALVGHPFPLLTHGSVTLIDVMGSDRRVVQAARTTSDLAAKTDKDDVNLLRYLLRQRHTTPFEFITVCLKVVCPMDLWRQWIRHRTFSVNEFSTRYSNPPDLCDETPADSWRQQSGVNRQGSSSQFVSDWPEGYEIYSCSEEGEPWMPGVIDETDNHLHWLVVTPLPAGKDPAETFRDSTQLNCPRSHVTPGNYLSARELQQQCSARDIYDERILFGVAKEQARKDLPLSQYTEAYWQGNLHNLLHFLSLRMDSHAQLEIRQYADAIGHGIVAKLFPVIWEAFCDYRLDALTLSGTEQQLLQLMLLDPHPDKAPYNLETFKTASDLMWWGKLQRCRERDECLVKLQKLGLVTTDPATP